MLNGSSLTLMMQMYPDRAFDVGIAEQHAVTFAAGLLAKEKWFIVIFTPLFYNGHKIKLFMMLHFKTSLVIFCLDRAGLVGEDGPTPMVFLTWPT